MIRTMNSGVVMTLIMNVELLLMMFHTNIIMMRTIILHIIWWGSAGREMRPPMRKVIYCCWDIVKFKNRELMGLGMNFINKEQNKIRQGSKSFVINFKNMSRIRWQMSPMSKLTLNPCQAFIIKLSGDILSLRPMCLHKLNLIILSNYGLRQYLIMHKKIFQPNPTPVRHFNVIDLTGELQIGVMFCVCLC